MIAVTPGEPAGIGPDILIQLIQTWSGPPLLAIANKQLMLERAEQLQLPLTLRAYPGRDLGSSNTPGELFLLEPEHESSAHTMSVTAGTASPDNASYVLATLRTATKLCQSGETQALVTGPVSKDHICQSGVSFSGHTEFLAGLTNTEQVVMMLASKTLRVALATTHLPLRDVADAIQPASLEKTIRILHSALKNTFSIDRPCIYICGLNPHAGENGKLGDEEQRVIEPCVKKLLAEDMHLVGPLPADSLFTEKHLSQADAVLAMYHDQGLPVLKANSFGEAVNITLGLPIIRTSVDHGTAFDLAGSGKSNPGSLKAAVDMAAAIADLRH